MVVRMRLCGVWLTENDVEILRELTKVRSWRKLWETRPRNGGAQEKLTLLNRLLGERLWRHGSRPLEINEDNVMKIINTFETMKEMVEDLENELRG